MTLSRHRRACSAAARYSEKPESCAMSMRRRNFIALLGSTAAMWPCLARAQRQARIPRVGVLWHAANIEEETPYYQNLVKGFSDLGYIDGQNITLEHRFPNEVPELFDKMAAELVSLNCDALVGAGAAGPHLKKSNKHNSSSVYVYS
jgi:putative tryptophan/tyrosine transport system substrate-binding protein